MAIYSNLEVFKATYDLLLLVYQTTSNVKREYRYTLAENIKHDITELCVLIYRANKADEKLSVIDTARELLVRVKLQCRMLVDLRQVSIKLFALVTEHTDSIQKQLDAWYKYNATKVR